MYIDDVSGISVGEDDKRAKRDYASAVHVIEDVIGMKAQLEHGKELPPTETTIDLLGATFNIPELDLDASDRFKSKAMAKLRQSRDEGQCNLVGCESITYTCNHAAQLSITEGRAHLRHFFVAMRRLRRNSERKQRISRICLAEIEWWIAELPKVRHVPWAPALFPPERGHPRRVDPEIGRLRQHRLRRGMPAARRNIAFFLRQMDTIGAGAAHKREGGIGIVLGPRAIRERHSNFLRKHALYTRLRKRAG